MAWLMSVLVLASYAGFYTSGRWQHHMAWRVSGPGPWGRQGWWLVRAWAMFGAVGLIAALLLGGGEALSEPPKVFDPVRAAVFDQIGGPEAFPSLFGSLAIGLVGGVLLFSLVELIRRWRRRPTAAWRRAVEARHWRDIPPIAASAITAGVTEELFFRLALPYALTAASGWPWAAQAVSAVLFAVLHRYQGWMGVIQTALVAMLFTVIYLGSGSILLAIGVHVLIDLNALILRPLIGGRLRLSS